MHVLCMSSQLSSMLTLLVFVVRSKLMMYKNVTADRWYSQQVTRYNSVTITLLMTSDFHLVPLTVETLCCYTDISTTTPIG